MTTRENSPSLIQTLEEVLPPDEAMVAHALITARFHVLPKGENTDGEPRIMILLPKTADTFE
jgi:hypothetical protein